MSKKDILPIVIGLNPPTKLVTVGRTEIPLKGYAVVIQHADFPEGTSSGDGFLETGQIEAKGTACWLQFRDLESLRRFGSLLVEYADSEK